MSSVLALGIHKFSLSGMLLTQLTSMHKFHPTGLINNTCSHRRPVSSHYFSQTMELLCQALSLTPNRLTRLLIVCLNQEAKHQWTLLPWPMACNKAQTLVSRCNRACMIDPTIRLNSSTLTHVLDSDRHPNSTPKSCLQPSWRMILMNLMLGVAAVEWMILRLVCVASSSISTPNNVSTLLQADPLSLSTPSLSL